MARSTQRVWHHCFHSQATAKWSYVQLIGPIPSGECAPLHEDLAWEEICFVESREWRVAFYGPSTCRTGGATVVLYDLDSINISVYFKYEFSCSKNVTESGALVFSLIYALNVGIRRRLVYKRIVERQEGALKEKNWWMLNDCWEDGDVPTLCVG